MSLEKARLTGYDNVKCLLIVLVVIGHVAEFFVDRSQVMKSIFLFIYFFHMPLFIFVAGLFQKQYKEGESFNLNKFLALIMLGYIYKVFKFLYGCWFGKEGVFHFLSEDGIPWFLFALAAFMGIMFICRNIKPLYLMAAAVVLACFSGYDKELGDFLCMSRIIVFLPFYAAGYYLEPDTLMKQLKRTGIKVLSGVVLVLMVYLCFRYTDVLYELRHLITGRNPFNEWDASHGGGILMRMICYVTAGLLGVSVISLMPNRKIPICTSVGQNSLRVYFWHKCIVDGVVYFGLADMLFTMGIPGKILLLFLGMAIAFITAAKPFAFPPDFVLRKSFYKQIKK